MQSLLFPFLFIAFAFHSIVSAQQPSPPTAAELRLSTNLQPIWYNLTIKVYVPGFIAFSAVEKNLTFEAALLIKFRCVQVTNRILYAIRWRQKGAFYYFAPIVLQCCFMHF